MEQRQHPSHPVRELALQVAAAHQVEGDTTESIVERAEKYAEFLSGE
jgi:hypothetical protein